MKPGAMLYAVFAAALLILAIGIPVLIHSAGGNAVKGWQGMVNPGPLSKAHQAFGAQCETCHTPHVGVETKTCIGCHAMTVFGDKQSTRFHANATQCTSCHVEHEGNRSLSRMNHDALLIARFWKVPAHRKTIQPGEPQSEEHPGRATANAGGRDGLGSLDCAGCHSNRDPHAGLFGNQCSSCHLVTSWKIEEFRHPSTRSTQCSSCHQAPPSHHMMHFEMVSQRVAGQRARVDQCYACHTTDSWNNIRRIGRYDHH